MIGVVIIIFLIISRWSVLEKKLASESVPEEEQVNLLKDLERKETNFMRLQRHKICVDDFDLLTIIGRGAFGEVRNIHDLYVQGANMLHCLVWIATRIKNVWFKPCCYNNYTNKKSNLNNVATVKCGLDWCPRQHV